MSFDKDFVPTAAARKRTPRWLADDERFWPVAAVLLGGLAILKGLRRPGDWALTQALLDYSQGFVKRGLLGTLYIGAGAFHRRSLTAVFFAELAILMLLLLAFTRRSGLMRRFGSAAVAALFAGSFAVTFLVHIVGYTDIVNAALAVTLLLIRSARVRFWTALPVFAVGLLVHENFVFLFAPVLIFSFFVQGLVAPEARRRVWTYALLLVLLCGLFTAATSLRGPMPDEKIEAMQNHIEVLSDFNVRDDFFGLLRVSMKQTVQGVSRDAWHKELWWEYEAVSVCVLAPVLLLLLHFCGRVLRAGLQDGRRERRWLAWGLLLAVCSPLALHLLGLDGVRWNVWVVVDAYLALGILCLHVPGPALRLSTAERNAILLAIALGMASGYGLFDGATVNPYPFFPRALQEHVQRHDGKLPGF